MLADQLVSAARTSGVQLTGPGGLLTGLTKQVLKTALDVELTEHLGHERHEQIELRVKRTAGDHVKSIVLKLLSGSLSTSRTRVSMTLRLRIYDTQCLRLPPEQLSKSFDGV